MKIQKIILSVVLASSMLLACKTETKKIENTIVQTNPNPKKVAFTISGMTCEIGCAKTIQSKLSKKAGISNAQVIFKDSMGVVEFDANQISATEIETFVNGIAGGDLYKVKDLKAIELNSLNK